MKLRIIKDDNFKCAQTLTLNLKIIQNETHPAVKQHNYTLLFITSGLGEGWFQNQAINFY